MKQRVKQIVKNPLIYGSSIVIFGGLAANFFNFLFNLYMSRNLSVSDYGILASIISLIGFPALLASAVSPMVVQFAGNYFALGKYDMLRGFYRQLFYFFCLSGIIIFMLFVLNLNQLGNFLHIHDNNLLFVVSCMVFFMIMGVINAAFIQAKLAFTFQVSMNIAAAVVKLLLGIALVAAGFAAGGAVYSLFAAILVTYALSFFPLRFVFDRSIATPKINTKELFSYGIPSTLTLVGLTSLISSDIILVKHFFDPAQAGIYAGLSLVARVIFFVSSPIASVMFPILVSKFAKKENITRTFLASLLLVIIPSFFMTLFYTIFPDFSILFFLKKPEYLAASPLLSIFAINISLYGVLFIICNFYLSIKKTNIYIPTTIGAILQIVLINFYHDSFEQVITISSVITFLLVAGLLLYYPYATKKQL